MLQEMRVKYNDEQVTIKESERSNECEWWRKYEINCSSQRSDYVCLSLSEVTMTKLVWTQGKRILHSKSLCWSE